MTILASAPLASLIKSLSTESEVSKQIFMERLGGLPLKERADLMKNGPLPLYSFASDIHLAVSSETGKLLYLLARSINARSIVEFGTSFGFSTLHLAAALRDLGAGSLISSEFEPSKIGHAKANLSRAGLLDLVELREGNALETLSTNLPPTVDFLFLDGAKSHYPAILALVEPNLRAGALVVADNADGSPEFLEHVRNGGGYISTAFKDVELSIRL